MIKPQLQRAIDGATFSEEEAEYIMDQIMTGNVNESQLSSLLTILRIRGETVDELTGFAKSMRSHAVHFPEKLHDAVDTCGTGGDGSSTFNISTAAAIVMSAMGVKVAKHGNRSFSSKSGSADVLERLNIPTQSGVEEAMRALKSHSMTFLFAPLYHPAMKHAIQPRKDIGFRTVFNILGPLSNPAGCDRQLIGVYNQELAQKMAKVVQRLGIEKALIVSGADGLDEMTITTTTNVLIVTPYSIQSSEVNPVEVGLELGSLNDIQVNSPEKSAQLIQQVFHNETNRSAKNIVILNAAAGLIAAGRSESFEKAVPIVKEALETGLVLNHYLSMKGKKERSYA
ncbi:anthranilate phosphoribosyltransferase [Pseudalkalibacillus berkeleyi]|uniref:Anthranilate phosphoribosyltransferase n=1 Tax=Pseudalkalibacillus berkeleyi TaxID=1069813 RepID=A0ABS9GXC7_9BACL|nr:anthranilate phosphoribosyltransferase [Pseudalkalibacillus berkeleyi]MCF6137434.1 anthranilate phosphoribosyltransferase [Pseudalkalibacillus berkeleyi]